MLLNVAHSLSECCDVY